MCLGSLNAQNTFDYTVELVAAEIPGLPGLHSFAYGQHEGKWLLVGGRLDGLHARQPFNSFPENFNNQELFVVDIDNLQFWSASLNGLPAGIQEQLQSTNMNFYQDGDVLYIIGGYAYSQSAGTHITFPNLTSIDVSGVIDAVVDNQPITPFFKQISDDIFAVTGGHLNKLGDTFYLVGGHRFDGRYNPMGNPTYTQTYTNAIRNFTIDNSGSQLSYGNFTETVDAVHLHRRDYNLMPQIFPNGERGFTISAGVFQQGVDLPFLYPVDITPNGYAPVTGFNQYLSHYHSASLSLYDPGLNHMHMLFFGGMSQYYYQDGNLVQDNLVPFVKTISRVSRDANGMLSEYLIPLEMPELQGSSAEFILHPAAPLYASEIIDLEAVTDVDVLVGHIFGGINSPTANPFSTNQTSTTVADATIYEVWLKPENLGINNPIDGSNPFEIKVSPNPVVDQVTVSFDLKAPTTIRYYLTNSKGQLILERSFNEPFSGYQQLIIPLPSLASQTLVLTVVFNDTHYVTQKLVKR
jgi:hypothetical protein